MQKKNKLVISSNLGWFLGHFQQNVPHKHYAIQLSVALDKPIHIRTEREHFSSDHAFLIHSNIPHSLSCEQEHLLILFNPTSSQGHFWNQYFTNSNDSILELNNTIIQQFRTFALTLIQAANASITQKLHHSILHFNCFCNQYIHQGDDRIEKAILYLNKHSDRIVSLEEIAAHCHLSPSRFLHLFKTETGQTYRRAQLWIKVNKGLQLMGKHQLTTIAHQTGFSDSAHFSRTFKENFGISPKYLSKNSQFIQV